MHIHTQFGVRAPQVIRSVTVTAWCLCGSASSERCVLRGTPPDTHRAQLPLCIFCHKICSSRKFSRRALSLEPLFVTFFAGGQHWGRASLHRVHVSNPRLISVVSGECAGIAGRVAIGVRGRGRSRVCVYRISGECCVPEPTGEGTWEASAVPF